MKTWHFPPYTQPRGLPAYWMDDQSGELPRAMAAYLDKPGSMSPEQFELVKAWVIYAVKAPAWKWRANQREESLTSLEKAETARDLMVALEALEDLGIDPI
jgi:hypothetical protein